MTRSFKVNLFVVKKILFKKLHYLFFLGIMTYITVLAYEKSGISTYQIEKTESLPDGNVHVLYRTGTSKYDVVGTVIEPSEVVNNGKTYQRDDIGPKSLALGVCGLIIIWIISLFVYYYKDDEFVAYKLEFYQLKDVVIHTKVNPDRILLQYVYEDYIICESNYLIYDCMKIVDSLYQFNTTNGEKFPKFKL